MVELLGNGKTVVDLPLLYFLLLQQSSFGSCDASGAFLSDHHLCHLFFEKQFLLLTWVLLPCSSNIYFFERKKQSKDIINKEENKRSKLERCP